MSVLSKTKYYEASSNQPILITGGLGFIGSHTCVDLIKNGHTVVIYDDMSNAGIDVLERIERLSGATPEFVEGDVRDTETLAKVIGQYDCSAAIHFAGLKAVAESVEQPLKYYDVNFNGTRSLIEAMKRNNRKQIVFSSSATVYGVPEVLPLQETHRLNPMSPYGFSKMFAERMLMDTSKADADWNITILRYFNPIGAHPSGVLGENPKGPANNLMPILTRVAAGEIKELQVFGDDYATRDGTGARDYIHVCDLARAHTLAIEKSVTWKPHCSVFNIGTGKYYTVLEIIKAFNEVNQLTIPKQIQPRRDGDIDIYYADPEEAKQHLSWEAHHSLDDMCRDSWNSQKKLFDKTEQRY